MNCDPGLAFGGDVPRELDLARAGTLGYLKLDYLARGEALKRNPEHKAAALAHALVLGDSRRLARVDTVELETVSGARHASDHKRLEAAMVNELARARDMHLYELEEGTLPRKAAMIARDFLEDARRDFATDARSFFTRADSGCRRAGLGVLVLPPWG